MSRKRKLIATGAVAAAMAAWLAAVGNASGSTAGILSHG
jgi:hypothetical protein